MNASRWVVGVICGVLLLPPLVGFTAEPRPTVKINEAKADKRPRNKDFNPTPQQIEEAEKFYTENAPNLAEAYKLEKDAISARKFMLRNLERWLTRNYLDLKSIENIDPTLYDMKIEQLKVQDSILGRISGARREHKLDPGNKKAREEMREELRPMVEKLLEFRKKEAEHRIKKMQALLESEQRQLDLLNKNGAAWVSNHIDEELNRAPRLIPPPEFRTEGPTTAAD